MVVAVERDEPQADADERRGVGGAQVHDVRVDHVPGELQREPRGAREPPERREHLQSGNRSVSQCMRPMIIIII